jgi:L-lactate utilization protein LutB
MDSMVQDIKEWFNQKNAISVVKALEGKNYDAFYAATREQALELVMNMIPKGSRVGTGGSMTVRQIGILDALEHANYRFYNQYRAGLSDEEAMEMRMNGLGADYFVTGTNAITAAGELINLDGFGNRVAGITYGPKKVIIVVGVNKLVESVERGIARVRNYAAVLNARRFNAELPCVKTGKCEDCDALDRICNHLLITYRQHQKGRVMVVVVGEELGF